MRILLANGVTLPRYLKRGDGDDLVPVWIAISGNKIEKVSDSSINGNYDQVIDLQGKAVFPGLIDPQVHFREPGQEYKEDIVSGSKAANRGGFTTVITMPNTIPTCDTPDVLKHIINRSREVGTCRLLPTAAVTKGLMGKEVSDMPILKEAGAIAFTDDGKGVQEESVFRAAMVEAAKLDRAILDHSEDESLSRGGAIHAGEKAREFGVPGILSDSESVHVERGCRLSLETGCHYHVLHISTRKSIEYVKAAKKQGARVTAEVSPHHLILCDEDITTRADGELDTNFKMNPPLRSRDDRQACIDALLDGTIDAIATDHAPHSDEEKSRPLTKAPFGIVGVETAFPLVYTKFVKTKMLSLSRFIYLMTEGPAKIFKLPYGTMNVGAVADLCVMDLNKKFKVNKDELLSKSKNTPFLGYELFGETKMTVFEGKVVYNQLQ